MAVNPDDKYFDCVTTPCKSCKIIMNLQTVQEIHKEPPFRIPVVIDCKDFQEECPDCGQENTYSHGDIHVEILANQPVGHYSHRFAAALKQAQEENEALRRKSE